MYICGIRCHEEHELFESKYNAVGASVDHWSQRLSVSWERNEYGSSSYEYVPNQITNRVGVCFNGWERQLNQWKASCFGWGQTDGKMGSRCDCSFSPCITGNQPVGQEICIARDNFKTFAFWMDLTIFTSSFLFFQPPGSLEARKSIKTK